MKTYCFRFFICEAFVFKKRIKSDIILWVKKMNNKYYDLYISEEIDDNIFDAKLANFEDHFWHMLCLSIYYQKHNDDYMEKLCLQRACDLNFAYSAMLLFDKKKVLDPKYQQYLVEFSNNMKDDKVEERIKYYNKKNANKKNLGFLWYSLISLSVIPVMLFLVFVCKLDTTISLIVSIVVMFVLQFAFQRMQKINRRKTYRKVESRLEKYLKYYDRFAYLLQNDLYIDLIRAKEGSKEEQEIIDKIKNGGK